MFSFSYFFLLLSCLFFSLFFLVILSINESFKRSTSECFFCYVISKCCLWCLFFFSSISLARCGRCLFIFSLFFSSFSFFFFSISFAKCGRCLFIFSSFSSISFFFSSISLARCGRC